LGAVSAPELALLEAGMGTLDQAGDIDELFRVLDQIESLNSGSVTRLRNAYNMDKRKFGGSFEDAAKARSREDIFKQYGVSAP